MAWSLLAHTSAGGTVGGVTTSAIDTTGSGFIVVIGSSWFNGGSPTSATMSDSKSNTWTMVGTADCGSNNTYTSLFYSIPSTVGSGHTFTFTLASSFPSIAVLAWNDAPSILPTVSGTTTSVTLTSTPVISEGLMISGMSWGGGSVMLTASINDSFTISDQTDFSAGNHFGVGAAYRVFTAPGTAHPTWSWTGNAATAALMYLFVNSTGSPFAGGGSAGGSYGFA